MLIRVLSSVRPQVYQGERRVAARNRFVGQFVLEDLPDGPAGRPLDLALSIDEDGILTVEAKLRSARNWEGCTLRLEDVAAVDVITNVEDADRYREEDDRELQRLQAKRRLEMFLENESDDVPLQVSLTHRKTEGCVLHLACRQMRVSAPCKKGDTPLLAGRVVVHRVYPCCTRICCVVGRLYRTLFCVFQNKRAFKETQLWCEHNDDATFETYRDKLAEAKRLRKTE